MNYYEVVTSVAKKVVIIDQEDFDKIEKYSGSGALIRVKQGIINPSFIVVILPTKVETKKKVEGHIDEKRGVFVVTGEKEIPVVEDKFNSKDLLENDNVQLLQ